MTLTMHLARVPLRIPAGWSVITNIFWDEEPVVENGVFVNAVDFTQDILLLETTCPPGAGGPRYVVSVGWYPEEDPEGSYRLVLERADDEEPIKAVESRERWKICQTIDRWLDVLSRPEFDGGGPGRL